MDNITQKNYGIEFEEEETQHLIALNKYLLLLITELKSRLEQLEKWKKTITQKIECKGFIQQIQLLKQPNSKLNTSKKQLRHSKPKIQKEQSIISVSTKRPDFGIVTAGGMPTEQHQIKSDGGIVHIY